MNKQKEQTKRRTRKKNLKGEVGSTTGRRWEEAPA